MVVHQFDLINMDKNRCSGVFSYVNNKHKGKKTLEGKTQGKKMLLWQKNRRLVSNQVSSPYF